MTNVTKRKQSRGNPTLTDRQRKFLELKTRWPYPSSAKAARLAGYSESVARKADFLITNSPMVRPLWEAWLQQEQERRRQEGLREQQRRDLQFQQGVLRRLRGRAT
jgi:hypothetical protein